MIIKNLKQILLNSKKEVKTQISSVKEESVECTIDDKKVDCEQMKTTPYLGVPAPSYLEDDPWFGPAPIKTQKQIDYMQQEMEIKRQEREQSFSVEPDNIHQKMYEIATKNQNTTLDLNPVGGSENFHEGPGGWNSGNGMGQFINE